MSHTHNQSLQIWLLSQEPQKRWPSIGGPSSLQGGKEHMFETTIQMGISNIGGTKVNITYGFSHDACNPERKSEKANFAAMWIYWVMRMKGSFVRCYLVLRTVGYLARQANKPMKKTLFNGSGNDLDFWQIPCRFPSGSFQTT